MSGVAHELEAAASTPTRTEVLNELDGHLATVVHTAVEHLLAQGYPDNSPLEVIVKATELRLAVLRERDRPHTTDHGKKKRP